MFMGEFYIVKLVKYVDYEPENSGLNYGRLQLWMGLGLALAHLLIAGSDTVPISVWLGGDTHYI